MARTKSNLTGDAIFEVVTLTAKPVKDGKVEVVEKVIGTFNSATPMNKASYAEVKRCKADLEAKGKKFAFQGRPDIGYSLFEATERPDKTVDHTLLYRVVCRMKSDTAGKTFTGRAACYAAPDGTLKEYVKKEQQSPKAS